MKTIALVIALLCLIVAPAAAQTTRLEAGDPPNPALITISEPDDEGNITLTGENNSVFPGAYLTIRNLYTGDVEFTQAGLTGTFEVTMRGVHNNPFVISPSQNAPDPVDYPGTLPGGPATIIASPRLNNPVRVETAGVLGESYWTATVEAEMLALNGGESSVLTYRIEVDPELVQDYAESQLCVQIAFPVIAMQETANAPLLAVSADGMNNGWSNDVTALGIGIVDGEADIVGSNCTAVSDLSTEIVIPSLSGEWEFAVREIFTEAALLAPTMTVSIRPFPQAEPLLSSESRLPLIISLNGADAETTELPFTLFWDNPSDGSRGILPSNTPFALVNRVRENSPTYILPPGEYPVEPYLPNILPNLFDGYAAPLIPFEYPNGRLRVEITRPDFEREEFTTTFTQNQLGRGSDDEFLFGRQSPIDTFRLTTDEPILAAYPFDLYGEYRIRVEADIDDIFGNAYSGGGDYRLWIAEPLDMTLGILPGAPLVVDQTIYMGGSVAPAVPAETTARVRYLPLGGVAPIETTLEMLANPYGVFSFTEGVQVFEEPGEYVIDYDATFTDTDGRLWMGSSRLAGVVVAPDAALIAHGERGVLGENTDPPPAWFTAREYADIIGADPDNMVVNTPYHSADIAHIGSDSGDGFAPRLWLQDTDGAYTLALLESDPVNGGTLAADSVTWGLPLTGGSYAYLSAVTPGVAVRQYAVTGTPDLPLFADSDDPLNGQIGAGFGGLMVGDVVFFFGGAVIRDEAAEIAETAGYASTAIVISNRPADPLRDPVGIRVYPPGREPAILSLAGNDHNMFVVPTGTNAGNILIVGETLAVAGQVAPALPADVRVTITAPDGTQQTYTEQANAYGYFYDADQDIEVNQVGVWTVQIHAGYDGMVSDGALESPLGGGPLGAVDETYFVYVTSPESAMIDWNPLLRDSIIPSALAYNFNFTAPPEWTDIAAYRTMTMPGYILQDEEMRLSGRSIAPQYNPQEMSRLFPNVEVEGRFSGAAGGDAKTLTIVFTGIDENGDPQLIARVFTIFHDRLITLGE
jgi:hypothetical protein